MKVDVKIVIVVLAVVIVLKVPELRDPWAGLLLLLGIIGVVCKFLAVVGVGAAVGIGSMVGWDRWQNWREGREAKKKLTDRRRVGLCPLI
jgi:hypothetical protein